MNGIHREVWHFLRHQGLYLIGVTSPVVLSISFWQNWLIATGQSHDLMQQWLLSINADPVHWYKMPLLHIQLREILPAFVADLLFNALAILAIDRCAHQRDISVRSLWKTAIESGPALFFSQILAQLAIFSGLLLLILPGIYLSGRLLLVSIEVMLDPQHVPLQALQRSWNLTAGRVWSLLGGYALWGILRMLLLGVIGVAFTLSSAISGGDQVTKIVIDIIRQCLGIWLYLPLLVYLYRVRSVQGAV